MTNNETLPIAHCLTQDNFLEVVSLYKKNLDKKIQSLYPETDIHQVTNLASHIKTYALYKYLKSNALKEFSELVKLNAEEDKAYKDFIRIDDRYTPFWLKSFVSENNKDLIKGIPIYKDTRTFNEANEHLQNALGFIKKNHPVYFEETISLLTRVEFYSGLDHSGGSGPRTLGCIFLAEHNRPMVDYSLTIVHEIGHMILNIIRAGAKVYENPETETIYSPIRDEVRPLWGVVHSAFILKRMLIFFDKIDKEILTEDNHKRRERISNTLNNTIELIENVKWTKEGKLIFDFIRS